MQMKPLTNTCLALAKKMLLWIGLFMLLWGLLGAFVIPYFAPRILANVLSEKLHRQVAVKTVALHPYDMSVSVTGFRMMEPDQSAVAASFDEIFVNLQVESLFRLAPVVREARLTNPRLNIIRNADGSYNFTDLIKEFLETPDDGSKPSFAVFNIQLQNGHIEFDDRLAGQKHTVSDLNIGVPFISNLPATLDTFVQPTLAAKIDGAAFALKGKTRPFRSTREASLDINLHELDLARFFAYLPVPVNFILQAGKLDSRLVISFIQPEKQAPSIILAGDLQLRQIQTTHKDGQALLSLAELGLTLHAFDVMNNSLSIDRINLQSPELSVYRAKDGRLNLAGLAATENPAKASKESAPAAPKKDNAFTLHVGEIKLTGGTVNLHDESPSKPFKTQLRDVEIRVRNFALSGQQAAEFEMALNTASGATLRQSGQLQLSPLRVVGDAQLQKLRLIDLAPYYQEALPLAIEDGSLDLALRYDLTADESSLKLIADDISSTINKLRLRQPGKPALLLSADSFGAAGGHLELTQNGAALEVVANNLSSKVSKLRLQQGTEQAIFAADSLVASGGELDLGKKTLRLNEIKSSSGKLVLVRNQDGSLNLNHLLKNDPTPAKKQAKAPPAPAWNITLNKFTLDRYSVRLDDRAVTGSLPILLEPITLNVLHLSNASKAKPQFSLKTGVGKQGHLEVTGTVGLQPFQAKLKLDASQISIVPLQPYFADRFNVLFTAGALSTRGDLVLQQNNNIERPFSAKFQGGLGISDLHLVEQDTSIDLLKWKKLDMDNLQVAVNTGEIPYDIAITELSLNQFYARIIVNADGRLALRKLIKGRDRDGSLSNDEGRAQPPATAPPASVAEASATATPQAFKLRLDKVTLSGGDVNFSDFFIKPNYSANLSEIGGSISGLSSEPGSVANVDLRGKVNGSAPLEISGKVNPLVKDIFLDLKASAKGIELSGINPYATRYAGYAIEKGKLSVDIHYFIKDRKLQAENHLFLDQLTFGQRVESPDATKLPVTLAIALLKNSKGEIDINLPIQGSLDDPEFSIGGIVWKMIGNLIVKIITSPFALLGSIFGGADQHLDYLEFDPGLASISKTGQEKLQTLSKALNDRPALKLDISGRVDPATDKEGLKQAGLQQKVKAQKLKATVSKGEDSASVDAVILSAEEWPVYLKLAYKEEKFPKPRNMIGFAKDLPPAEMEKLILANITVSEEDLRRLANERATAVSAWLVKSGGVAAERVFITSPKLNGDDLKDKGKPNRVDFSLK